MRESPFLAVYPEGLHGRAGAVEERVAQGAERLLDVSSLAPPASASLLLESYASLFWVPLKPQSASILLWNAFTLTAFR
jgi:hypothetical protein